MRSKLRRMTLVSGCAALAAGAVFAIPALAGQPHGAANATGSVRTALLAAALAADNAEFSSVVVPSGSTVKLNGPAGMSHAVIGLSAAEAPRLQARAMVVVHSTMIGALAARQAKIVNEAFAMAIPHTPEMNGAPVSVVSTAGGIRDYVVKSATIDGSTATVVASCTTYMTTHVTYVDGIDHVSSPMNDEVDTITLAQKGSTWKVSGISVAYPNGGP